MHSSNVVISDALDFNFTIKINGLCIFIILHFSHTRIQTCAYARGQGRVCTYLYSNSKSSLLWTRTYVVGTKVARGDEVWRFQVWRSFLVMIRELNVSRSSHIVLSLDSIEQGLLCTYLSSSSPSCPPHAPYLPFREESHTSYVTCIHVATRNPNWRRAGPGTSRSQRCALQTVCTWPCVSSRKLSASSL